MCACVYAQYTAGKMLTIPCLPLTPHLPRLFLAASECEQNFPFFRLLLLQLSLALSLFRFTLALRSNGLQNLDNLGAFFTSPVERAHLYL